MICFVEGTSASLTKRRALARIPGKLPCANMAQQCKEMDTPPKHKKDNLYIPYTKIGAAPRLLFLSFGHWACLERGNSLELNVGLGVTFQAKGAFQIWSTAFVEPQGVQIPMLTHHVNECPVHVPQTSGPFEPYMSNGSKLAAKSFH